jgi:transposase
MHHRDAVLLQQRARPDAGKLQQLRRVDRPAGQQHLAPRAHLTDHAILAELDARQSSLWFLPGYTPDLNPFEQGFSKLKALIRKAAPRTREALWQRTGSIVQDFTPAECANFLANAGYKIKASRT